MALRLQPNLNKENGPASNIGNAKITTNLPVKLTRPALGDVRNKLTINAAQPSKGGKQLKPEVVAKLEVFHKDDIRITRSKTIESKQTKVEIKEKSPIPMECDLDSESYSSKLLPTTVPDVDCNDTENPQMVYQYAKEIFEYLNSVEIQMPIKEDFLSNQKEVNSRMRAILVDWLVQVHQRFSLLQETLFLSVAILDRFLQVQQVSKSHLQLVGVTAMYLAGKYEEMYPAEVTDYVYITDNAYTKKEIFKMEMAILRGLTFDLNRPLPIHFLRRYSKVGNCDANVHQLAKYLMELSLPEYTLCHYLPSHLASAALYLSLNILEEGEDAKWSDTLVFYSGYSEEDLEELVQSLAKLLSKAERCKLQAVRSKYAHTKFGRISEHPALKSAKLIKFT